MENQDLGRASAERILAKLTEWLKLAPRIPQLSTRISIVNGE
jgi:hypothetical protein